MADKPPLYAKQKAASSQRQTRDDRLKAALKENLARRKAQTRARRVSGNKTETDNTDLNHKPDM